MGRHMADIDIDRIEAATMEPHVNISTEEPGHCKILQQRHKVSLSIPRALGFFSCYLNVS